MVKTSPAQKKATSKSANTSKKPAVASKAAIKKTTPKKRAAAKKQTASVSQKVDYYPNRMTLAISALAGTLIVLLALIAVLGQS